MLFALALVLLAPAQGDAPNAPTLLKYAALNAASFLDSMGERKELGVDFQGPPVMRGSGEAAFLTLLGEQLKAAGVKVSPGAAYTLRIVCRLDRAAGLPVGLDVNTKLIDGTGDVALDNLMGLRLDDPDELRRYCGVSGVTGERKLEDQIRTPQLTVTGRNTARTRAAGPFGVQVLVGGRPRPIMVKPGGRAFTALALGEEYEVRVVNESAEEVLAGVYVDGLSTFHFGSERVTAGERKGQPRYRFFVIGPGRSVTVEGWHRRFEAEGKARLDRFKVTVPEDSAAGKLGKTDLVGSISVDFLACKKAGGEEKTVRVQRNANRMVAVKVLVKNAKGKPMGLYRVMFQTTSMSVEGTRVGTGFGTEKLTDARKVQRWIGPVLEVITVHYERGG